MARNLISLTVPLFIAGVFAGTSMTACGSDEDDGGGGGGTGATDAGTTGGSGGGGGATGGGGGTGGSTGGTGGSAGGTGGGGGMMTADAGDIGYTCIERQMDPSNDPDPGGDVTEGTDCCSGLGTCTAEADVSGDPSAGSFGHENCEAPLLCAPKDPADLPDGGALPSCTTDIGGISLEGRCLPKCFALGDPQAANLNVGDCPTDAPEAMGEEVVCAPCFNPVDGSETGACSRNGDTPATTAPEPFAPCGIVAMEGGATSPGGVCVPIALIEMSGNDTSLIPQDTCEDGELCAPTGKVLDPTSCFEPCDSEVVAIGFTGPGACLAPYLVENRMPGASALVSKGDCPGELVCAPCEDPLAPGSPTGACQN